MNEAMKWPDARGKSHQRPMYAALEGACTQDGGMLQKTLGIKRKSILTLSILVVGE